ncbi:MAG TPA: enolase C-terminal domain-like protein [Kofleriaceae bacterium]|jgi:muconate cycloisomerase
MRVAALAARRIQIPIGAFEHSSRSRSSTDNIVCAITLEDGTVGYGEGVPRDYVTGETIESAWATLGTLVLPAPPPIASMRDALVYAEHAVSTAITDSGDVVQNACRSAVELALLDAYGRVFNTSLTPAASELTGTRPGPVCTHSLVLDRKAPRDPDKMAAMIKRYGFRAVKIKVGFGIDEDIENIAAVRQVFGPDGELRVDANRAWTFDEAVAVMERARELGVTAVEDPVKGDDPAELRRLREKHGVRVILDESIRTRDEAARAIDNGAVDVFNLRVSKNGGLVRTLQIAKLAQDRGVGLQVGTQVGETAILTSAGRHLSYSAGPVVYLESSNEHMKFTPERYVSVEDLNYDAHATSPPLTGPGLGITVLPERLDAFTTERLDRTY